MDGGVYEIQNCSIEYQALLESEGKDYADSYFKPGVFTDQDVQRLNGDHFIFGYLESLGQSDRCPAQYQTSETPCTYKVEQVIDDVHIPIGLNDQETLSKAYELLRKTYERSLQYMENMNESTVQNPKVLPLYQHYWISNLKIEAIADMLDIIKK